jgi:hypothetical protein
MDGAQVDNSLCGIGMITNFVSLRAGNALFGIVALMGFSQVVDHHGAWEKHAFAHVTVGMCDVAGTDPAENMGIALDTMVIPLIVWSLTRL